MNKRLEPPQIDSDITVSKYDENSIRYLAEELNDIKRYLTIISTKKNHRIKDKFGCNVLCQDCNLIKCSILQPFGYNKPKKIQCDKCGYLYFSS